MGEERDEARVQPRETKDATAKIDQQQATRDNYPSNGEKSPTTNTGVERDPTDIGGRIVARNDSPHDGQDSPTYGQVIGTAVVTGLLNDDKDAAAIGQANTASVSRRRSPSRDSSFNDDPKSLFDSISAASGRQNWSGKDVIEEDPSISSIKGDSVSATIADYNKKHRGQSYSAGQSSSGQADNQSRSSVGGGGPRLIAKGGISTKTHDDSSVNINLYPFPVSGSTSEIADLSQHSFKAPDDIAHLPTVRLCSTSGTSWSDGGGPAGGGQGADNFDMIEESNDASSCDELAEQTIKGHRGPLQSDGSCSNHSQTTDHTNQATTSSKSHHHRHHHAKQQQRHHHHYHKRSTRNERRSRRSSAAALEHALEIDNIPQEASVYQMEPIILRGNGNLTLFGLSNSFSSEFPSALIGRVSKEEFNNTIRQINKMLREQQSLSAKLLLFGGLFCCCSFGFSLVWPSIVLRKRSKMNLEKFLASENCTLYSKLGLNWKLAEQRCYSNHSFIEYVIMIEFLPKENLYAPD